MPETRRPFALELTALTQPRFGQLVWELRRRSGLTLRQAAESTGVSRSMLSRLENGHDVPLSAAVAVLTWAAPWY